LLACYSPRTVSPSCRMRWTSRSFLFSSTATAPTEIYTLSLHDALPILTARHRSRAVDPLHQRVEQDVVDERALAAPAPVSRRGEDRKSTRLNSSHRTISYAVFCLKKKKREQCRKD